MAEKWKAIPGYEGYYEVSDQGQVRSLDRVVEHARGPWRYKGKILKLTLGCSNKYLSVQLFVDGSGVRYYVHRLVLAAFSGPCPVGYEVGHRDGTRTNNCLQNLRYITRAKNQHEAITHGRFKFSPDKIREIRTRVAAGETHRSLARELDVDHSRIGRIARRELYASVPEQPCSI